MNWLENLQRSISFIESHLLDEDLTAERVANEAQISSFYFQKGFSILTGISVGEYIRNRKLYLSAIEIARGEKIIDVALRFGWETPESFSKAFSRFHGTTPASVKGDVSKIKVFLPFTIRIAIAGGTELDFKIEKMQSFKVIGFEREFNMETSKREIPKFWDEILKKHGNKIGEFGVCVDCDVAGGNFFYMIADNYTGGEVPNGMTVREIPAATWAKFACAGPMPGALQSVDTAIFNEWLPTNGKYEIAGDFSIEWYDSGDPRSADYKSEIWIPVKECEQR